MSKRKRKRTKVYVGLHETWAPISEEDHEVEVVRFDVAGTARVDREARKARGIPEPASAPKEKP